MGEALPQPVLGGTVQARPAPLRCLPGLEQLTQLGSGVLPLRTGRVLLGDGLSALDDRRALLEGLLLGGRALGGHGLASLGGHGLECGEAGPQSLQVADGGRLGEGLGDRGQGRVDLSDAELGQTGGEQVDGRLEIQVAAHVEGHGLGDRGIGELADLALGATVLDVDPTLTVDAPPLGGVHGLLRVNGRFGGRRGSRSRGGNLGRSRCGVPLGGLCGLGPLSLLGRLLGRRGIPEAEETDSSETARVDSSVGRSEGSLGSDSFGAATSAVASAATSVTGEVAASGACSIGVGAVDSSRPVGWMVCSVSGWFRSVTGCSFMG